MLLDHANQTFDQCIKCTVCTAYCPVAKANPAYPGPKQAGPDGERLRIKSRYSTLPLHLLGPEFTLSEVQRAFEIILQTPMNTAAFRKRIHRADILVDTGRKRTGKQRPAILYRLESPCCVMFDQVMHGAEA